MTTASNPCPFLYVCENCSLVVGDENYLPPSLPRCPSCGSQHSFTRHDGPHEPLPGLTVRGLSLTPELQSELRQPGVVQERRQVYGPGAPSTGRRYGAGAQLALLIAAMLAVAILGS